VNETRISTPTEGRKPQAPSADIGKESIMPVFTLVREFLALVALFATIYLWAILGTAVIA
jgi:hypothetical protein